MAVILAESVAITKSRLVKGFNGDNLNLNGRVISLQEADAGFKAAGSVKPPYIAVVASGNQKGFASGAANAFNDYVKDINLNKYNAEPVISRYFDDMQAVVDKCGIEGGKLSVGIVCVYDDCVIAAKSGGCHLLRFSQGELFEIALSEEEDGRGYQFVDMIADGDMFALIGEEACQDLDYAEIVNSFDSGNDLKTMIRDFYKILALGAKGNDCSVVLMKLKNDSERTYAAAPLVVPDESVDGDANIPVGPAEFDAEPPVNPDELADADGYVSDEESPETGERPKSAKKKLLGFIPIAILVVILAITAGLYFATHYGDVLGNKEESSSDAVDGGGIGALFNPVSDDEDGESQTMNGDFNGSNGMQDVEDIEQGGNVGNHENNNSTTNRQETSTRAPETTTHVQETTTLSNEGETTTLPDETTTSDSGEETTTSSDETDTTTQTPDTTESTTVASDNGTTNQTGEQNGEAEPALD